MNSTDDKPRAFNTMQIIKRRLFAMRNGVIADTLRRAGSPHRIIFGVNVPQLAEIAADTGSDAELAEMLWANTTTRESMLLAPMLYPAEKMDIATARRWAAQVPSTEVADILCHRLLRKLGFALQLADELAQSDSDIERYTGLRLMFNIVGQYPHVAGTYANNELGRNCPLTARVAAMLADEAKFLLDE